MGMMKGIPLQKTTRAFVAIGIAILMLAMVVAGCGGDSKKADDKAAAFQKVVLKLGTETAVSHPETRGSQKLADIVREKSKGTLEIHVYDSAKIGSMKERIEGMRLGTVDISTSSVGFLANYIPVLAFSTCLIFIRTKPMSSACSMATSARKLIKKCRNRASEYCATLIWVSAKSPTIKSPSALWLIFGA